MLAASFGMLISASEYHISGATADYYSVIRALNRYGCDMESAEPTRPYRKRYPDLDRAFESVQENHSDEHTNVESELSAEEIYDTEKLTKYNDIPNVRKLFVVENELTFREIRDLEKVDPEEQRRLEIFSVDYTAVLERPSNTLVDAARFLCRLGLDVNTVLDGELTLLVCSILNITCFNSSRSQPAVLNILFLCLLKADVSVREPRSGMQVLHLLLHSKRSNVTSSQFEDLAYILIRYGGADVSATMYDGRDPTDLAYTFGWLEEWFNVLRRCGIDIERVLSEGTQRTLKFQYAGLGDSTAVDIHDMLPICSETITRRKPIVGDRLVE